MKTTYTITRALALLFALTGLLNIVPVHVYSSSDYNNKPPASRYDSARLKKSYSKLPLSFEANYGQADKKIKFTSRGSGYSLALTPTTFTLAVANKNEKESRTSVLQATLLGGNAAANLTGLQRLLTKSNYFIGSDPRRWKTNIPNYAKVKYSGVYPGIDLVFYGNQNLLEYDFTVSPGADPGAIALGFEGITGMRVDEKGDLLLRTDAGEIRHSKPVVYQQINNARRMIPASYLIKGEKQIAFQIANYDRSKPLVIDPTLVFSTYLGGSGTDRGDGIAVDADGNAYITGSTASTDFPVTPGAFQTQRAGLAEVDAFVTKMNSTGTALIYSTYFGGGNRDAGNDIALDAAGNAYITGLTDSGDLPTTPGAFRTTPVGGDEFNAFATKLNPTGTALIYSTYLGPVVGSGIAVDSAGNAYITGQASDNYPTTPGAFQPLYGGSSDGFVTKLNATGTALVYSTYLGGTGFDVATEIAIDAAGNAYVTGQAGDNFPVTPGAFQTFYAGSNDGFVTKLNATGTALVYSTYLGGSNTDSGNGIAVNAAGNAYVTGGTDSFNFPTTTGALQNMKAAGLDAFVTQLSATGDALVYSTYLGGNASESGFSIALDAAGNASVTGVTDSTDFPTTPDAIQSDLGGVVFDAFITRLNANGAGLVFSTYLGGSGGDSGFSIFVDAAGSIYVTGQTSSANFPTTPGAFQTMLASAFPDAFVTKIEFPKFDVCFRDDGNGDSFQFNSTTGEYRFTQSGPGGLTVTGTGTLSQQGCLLVLEDNQSGQRVKAHLNHCNNKGQAVIQIESGKKRTFVVTDKNRSDSSCN